MAFHCYSVYNLDSRETHIYFQNKNGGNSKGYTSPLVPCQSTLEFLTVTHVK